MKLCTKAPSIMISQTMPEMHKKFILRNPLTSFIIARHVVTLAVAETLVKML